MKRRADVTVYTQRFGKRPRKDPLQSVTLDTSASTRKLEGLLHDYLTEQFPFTDLSIMAVHESPPSGCYWIDVQTDDRHLSIQLQVSVEWFDWDQSWMVVTDSAQVHTISLNGGIMHRIRTWHHPRYGWSTIDIDGNIALIQGCDDRFDAYYRIRRALEDYGNKESAARSKS
jgi:hypothetical protein